MISRSARTARRILTVGDAFKCRGQPSDFGACHPGGVVRMARAVKQCGDWDLQDACDVKKTARRNAVGSVLVFLNLLEGQTKGRAECGLRHAFADTETLDIPPDAIIEDFVT
jgi:hypothetical protein